MHIKYILPLGSFNSSILLRSFEGGQNWRWNDMGRIVHCPISITWWYIGDMNYFCETFLLLKRDY